MRTRTGSGKRRKEAKFLERYGPWALVAGASKGIGAAFAELLAEQGLKLILVARNRTDLKAFARGLEERHGIQTRTIALDLSDDASAPRLVREFGKRDLGLVIYNAALSPIGPFLSLQPKEHLKVLAANCRTPLVLTHAAASRMRERGRGGIVLVSSFSGLSGGTWFAAYSASKAYLTTLAESLWYEFKREGVDVVAPIFGAVGTPTYWSGLAGKKSSVPVMDPRKAARIALRSLGKQGSVVPGLFNKVSAFMMNKFMGRKMRTRIMGAMMRGRL